MFDRIERVLSVTGREIPICFGKAAKICVGSVKDGYVESEFDEFDGLDPLARAEMEAMAEREAEVAALQPNGTAPIMREL